MQSLGRSVFGIDLTSAPLRSPTPCTSPRPMPPTGRFGRFVLRGGLPTPARRRARAAVATMLQVADDILQACRADPDRDAPLVHALIAAVDR